MYVFEAKYVDMDTNRDVTREIEFDGQFLDSERQCFVYAMERAYDLAKDNELFVTLEYVTS